ncbi:divergent polysaccharide deacetylase family protein [Neptunomonas sp.]|uniref:divergent polysaccharide deacetylase family protein n=1 Tax=Neptunomonas sp. TaxID=1971898 RepID=UPI0025DF9B26|nr:divergent polysaccharide deacetylase family protein [Neptunomonas sp.]
MIGRWWGVIFSAFLSLSLSCQAETSLGMVMQPRIVIVIDDVGNNLAQGKAALALPGPVTYSVLPYSAHGKTLAYEAHRLGKDVMLHAPMANTQNLKLGPGGLTPDLTEARFKQILNGNLDAVPHAVGLNNHMGSLLTRQRVPMKWVMEVAKSRGVFFLDSRTTRGSVAWSTARKEGVPAISRDIFLDHEQTEAFLSQQFIRAVKIARKYGSAVVIGHPYPITTTFLEKAIPALDEAGVQLVSAPALIMQNHQAALLAQMNKKRQKAE